VELGLHDAALRVFHHARQQVSDPQLRILVLKLEADCTRFSTRTIEGQIVQLAEKEQVNQALKLVHDALQRQPSNIVFLYHLANLQLRSGNRDAARQTIDEARRHVGRDSVDLIAEIERKIEFGPYAATIEQARVALRRRDTVAASRHLDSCSVLDGNDHFEGLRAYAESKRLKLGQLFAAKRREQPASVQQQTLRWLLAEEIQQADTAMRAGDYARARVALEAALRVEPDCGAVLYKHASAIAEANRAHPTEEELKQAEAMAARSTIDATYQELAGDLIKKIRALRARPR
jgi:thioredoxin-like negative regulator of GroEL